MQINAILQVSLFKNKHSYWFVYLDLPIHIIHLFKWTINYTSLTLLSYKILPDENDNIRLYSTLGYNDEHKTFSSNETVPTVMDILKVITDAYG